MKKIITIIFSRFSKPTEQEQEIARKRKICKACIFNTINQEKIPFKKRIIKFFSDLYSRITGNADKDNLGNCSICDMCSIYYKTKYKTEKCKKGFWNDDK